MALNKKNSRCITINNETFRWTISLGNLFIVFVAEKENAKGRKIEVHVKSAAGNFWLNFPDASGVDYKIIKPKDAAIIITQALEKGWNPREKGKPLVFDWVNEQLKERSKIIDNESDVKRKVLIKKLRNKIPIPLTQAIELLNKNDGNIKACEDNFHKNNIIEIAKEAECSFEKAERFYKKFNHNKEKTIKGINEEGTVISVGNRKVSNNGIGFILWFEDENGKEIRTQKRNDIFIHTEDFGYIIEVFKTNCSNRFSAVYDNYFNKTECESIIRDIDNIQTKNTEVLIFSQKVNQWLRGNLEGAETLVIEGTL